MRHENAVGDLLSGFDYAYDREGNRRFERDLVAGTADVYTYDSAYRLSNADLRALAGAVAVIANNTTSNAEATQNNGNPGQRQKVM